MGLKEDLWGQVGQGSGKTLATALVPAVTLAAPGNPKASSRAGKVPGTQESPPLHMGCSLHSAALPFQKSDLIVGDDYSLPEEFFNL